MAVTYKKKMILVGFMLAISCMGLFLVISTDEVKKDNISLEKLKWSGENMLVIKPRLTEAAYSENGFYSYYKGKCGTECLSIPLQEGPADSWGTYNKKSIALFHSLGYPMENDSDIHLKLLQDKNYLKQYDALILLHSEYVTKELYQAITGHPKVIYLAPNALYAEITYDGDIITLIRGHNYPDESIRNGFGWQHDNSSEEYDLDCLLWNFRQVSNGYQLNCVQEIYSQNNPRILLKMKELIQ